MRATLEIVDTVGFTGMVRELSGKFGVPVWVALYSETAAVLSRCISLTPRKAPQLIRRSVEYRNRTLWEGGDPDNYRKRGSFIAGFDKSGAGTLFETSNWDGKGKQPKLRGGKSFHYTTEFQHWSDVRWARWQAALAKMKEKAIDVAKAVRSSGVAKATWYQIAHALGIESQVKAPGYVQNAVSRDGRVYIHGTARKVDTPQQLFVEIRNDSNLVVSRLNGASILSRAINGRIGYFNKNLETGVFEDIRARVTKYRGIAVGGHSSL